MSMLERLIVEAASDYKMALQNEGFAQECGGVDKLRADLFALVEVWEGEIDDSGPPDVVVDDAEEWDGPTI